MPVSLNYGAIGERIRRLRKTANLTQERLSEVVGISSRHMSKIETGSCPLSLPCLVNVAVALNTTPDALLMDSVPEARPHLLGEAESLLSDCSSPELFVILRTIAALKESMRVSPQG